MKLFTCLLAVCSALFFTSCIDRMETDDIAQGTPTRIDTIIHRNYVPPVKTAPVKKEAPEEGE